MRAILISAAIAGCSLAGANPSFAYTELPWCVKANVGRSSIDLCYYRNFAECSKARFDYFSTAVCVHNPRYLPYWTTGEPPQPGKTRRMSGQ